MVEEDTSVIEVVMRNVRATSNVESGLDIAISGTLSANNVLSAGNGLPDNIITG